MSKFKCQTKSKFKFRNFWILGFDIHLTFACLREAASAKAGILSFGILVREEVEE
jgi:hypothetical protein